MLMSMHMPTTEKFEKEAAEMNKRSFKYAWGAPSSPIRHAAACTSTLVRHGQCVQIAAAAVSSGPQHPRISRHVGAGVVLRCACISRNAHPAQTRDVTV